MNVEVRHFRAFLAIVDERNITRAAERLHMSQPALSRTLAQLERHVGVALIERSTHHLEVTAAGATLAVSAAEVVRAFDTALQHAAGAPLPIRFGQSWSSTAHAAAILRAWNEAYPTRPVITRHSDDRLAGLSSGAVDVALVRAPTLDRAWRSVVVDLEPRFAAVPAGHRLSKLAEAELGDLAGDSLVVNTLAGTTTLDLWPAGRRPTIVADVGTIDDWLMAIAAGVGVGVTAGSTATLHPHPDIRYVALRDAPPVSMLLVWPARHAHPQTKAFVAVARRAVRSLRARSGAGADSTRSAR